MTTSLGSSVDSVPKRPTSAKPASAAQSSGDQLRSSVGGSSVEAPAARDALELVLAGVDEREPAPGDEILDSPRHQDLRRARPRGDPGADRHGEPARLPVDDLAFADVHPGTCLDSEARDLRSDLLCAVDRPRRPYEAREETVTCRVVLCSLPVGERTAHRGVMREHELPPAVISKLCLLSRRVDDVREEHRDEDRRDGRRSLYAPELADDRHLLVGLEA